MASRKSAIVALALWAGLMAPARAGTPDSDKVAAGRTFAGRVCGACHVVTQQRDELPVRFRRTYSPIVFTISTEDFSSSTKSMEAVTETD